MKKPLNEEDSAYLREMGARIFIARRRKGWNQKDLAEKVGLTAVHISRIERGHVKTSIVRIRQIKIALDMEWDEIFP